MKSISTQLVKAATAASVAAALAGCFGGGDDEAPPPADPLASVPDSATQTVAGTLDYLTTLSKNQSDTREPIDVSKLVLPTSDTTEPQALN